jgi:hypothetical protein
MKVKRYVPRPLPVWLDGNDGTKEVRQSLNDSECFVEVRGVCNQVLGWLVLDRKEVEQLP